MAKNESSIPENMLMKEETENLRTEYTALTSYSTTVVNFRFTVLGLYLAAVGIILGGKQPTWEIYFLLCLITICVFMIELRNQSLLKNISNRGMQIEHKYWGYSSDDLSRLYPILNVQGV
jgi:hypothetical protein